MSREKAVLILRLSAGPFLGVLVGAFYGPLATDDAGVEDRVTFGLCSLVFFMFTSCGRLVIEPTTRRARLCGRRELLRARWLGCVRCVHAVCRWGPTLGLFLPEVSVVRKEINNNWYGVWSYYLAKILLDTPTLLFQPLLYSLVVGFWLGIVDSFYRWFMLYFATASVCNSVHAWAIFISACVGNEKTAQNTAPFAVMPLLFFSGFFQPVAEIPWYFRWISYLDIQQYCYVMISVADFEGVDFPDSSYGDGETVLNDLLLLDGSRPFRTYWVNALIIWIFIIFLRVSAGFLMK